MTHTDQNETSLRETVLTVLLAFGLMLSMAGFAIG